MTTRTGQLRPLPDRAQGRCFGCGPQNGVGLGMRFFTDGVSVSTELAVPVHFCGWGNVVHGGIISTILDEIMGWSGIWLLQRIVLTKTMSVEFHKPVMACEKIKAVGSVQEHSSERQAIMKSELYNSSGDVCARANGVFALFTKEAAKKLGFIDLAAIDEIADNFLA